MFTHKTLLKKLATIGLRTERGPWNRMVAHANLIGPPPGAPAGSRPRPLWPGGAKIHGQRFTPKGSFDTAYLASDAMTAAAEVNLVLIGPGGVPIPIAGNPQVLVSITGDVRNVLDTTDPTIQRKLNTTVTELAGPWAYVPGGGLAATQILGGAAYASKRVHAIKYQSTKNPSGICLAVFPDRLSPKELLEVVDSSGNLVDSLP